MPYWDSAKIISGWHQCVFKWCMSTHLVAPARMCMFLSFTSANKMIAGLCRTHEPRACIIDKVCTGTFYTALLNLECRACTPGVKFTIALVAHSLLYHSAVCCLVLVQSAASWFSMLKAQPVLQREAHCTGTCQGGGWGACVSTVWLQCVVAERCRHNGRAENAQCSPWSGWNAAF